MLSEQRSAFTSIRIFSTLLLLYTLNFPYTTLVDTQSWEPDGLFVLQAGLKTAAQHG